MTKISSFSKGLCLILIASIFFISCDIPDISEFTSQSAEMTRGIRQGVKDTGDVLKTAAANDVLFEPETVKGFQKLSKNYNTVMKPTLETLDALDSYVEALNALAQANKKSVENSKALVGAVDNLVTSASSLVVAAPAAAFEIPELALKIGTGVLAAIESFRTAKSFKKRVNAAADIVEGKYDKKEELVGGKKVIMYKKKCTDDKKAVIENIGKRYAEKQKEAISKIETDPDYIKLTNENDKKDFLKKALADNLKTEQKKISDELDQAGCGIIDLLTFTMQDLRRINKQVSDLTEENFLSKNRTTFGLYQGINKYYERVQNEITKMLEYKTILTDIRKLNVDSSRATPEQAKILEKRIANLKNTAWRKLNDIYDLDGQVQIAVKAKVAECDAPAKDGQPPATTCVGMTKYLICEGCANDEEFDKIINAISPEDFTYGGGFIETALNTRAIELFAENQGYLTERERMQPDYERVNTELDKMRQNQIKTDKLMTLNIAALNTWSATHADLRETVNKKKPLSFETLKTRVKDILTVLEPEETE